MATSPIKNLGANGMPALCGHIKNLRNIVYLIGNAFQDTMSEIEEAINDYPVASSISISTSGWQELETTMGDYAYYYDITVNTIDSSDLPIVVVSPSSMSVSAECGLCQTCESLNGTIRLFAKTVPSENMTISCWVIKGQTSAEKDAAMDEIEDWDVMGSVSGGI